MTDLLLSDLRATLARAEALATEMVAVLSGAAVPEADPLAAIGPVNVKVRLYCDDSVAFRLPDGAVAYDTTNAYDVRVGDWVQRCHGDPDWHLVEDVIDHAARGCCEAWKGWVRITHDGTAHDYRATDAIRVAHPPADVIARQERKWENPR